MAPPQRHYVNLKGSAVLYAEEVSQHVLRGSSGFKQFA